MPILVIGISTDGARPRLRQRAAGFSLLELMVVVTIIGIFVGMAVLSFDVAGRDRASEQQAARLKGIIDLVREEALMQSRDFGILFGEHSYRFYVYDYQQLGWYVPAGDQLLAEHSIGDRLSLALVVEDREIVLESAFDEKMLQKPQPQVMILSSGEMTPFEAQVFRDIDGGRYVLTAAFDGAVEVSASGFDEP